MFPVEGVNRELDFRLVLATLAARSSNRIWVGQQKAVGRLIQALPSALYVGQNFSDGFPGTRYSTLKKRGGALIHLLEEGGVFNGGPETWQKILLRRLDPRGLDANDSVCAWGEWQRDYYRSLQPKCEENIVATGHPRFDLLKPQFRPYFDKDVEKIRERWGDFVLINTNITRANNASGLKYWFGNRKFYQPEDFEARTALIDHWAHQLSLWGGFVKLVNRLAHQFPETTFVIRPHPAEIIENYTVFFDNIPNVHVVREGGIGAWLLASRAMIHDGCTTGLEAHFADVPVINWKPLHDERYDLFLPNSFGTVATTEAAAIDLTGRAIAGTLENPRAGALPPLATAMLHNLEHDAFGPLVNLIQAREKDVAAGEFDLRGWARRENWRDARRKLRRRKPDGKWNGFSGERLDERMNSAMRVANKTVRWTLWNDAMLSIEAD